MKDSYTVQKNLKKQVFRAEAAVNAHTQELSFPSADKCYRGQVQSNLLTSAYVVVTRSTTNAAYSKTSSAPRSRGHRQWPRVQSRSRGQGTMHPEAAVRRGQTRSVRGHAILQLFEHCLLCPNYPVIAQFSPAALPRLARQARQEPDQYC